MNFWQKRKIRKTLRKFREAAVSLRHADDDILSQDQKTALDQLIQDAREAEKNCDPAAEKQLTEHLTHIVPPRRFLSFRACSASTSAGYGQLTGSLFACSAARTSSSTEASHQPRFTEAFAIIAMPIATA